MRTIVITLTVLLIALSGHAQKEPTARSYYKQLYQAGRLDPLADSYVCFSDERRKGHAFLAFGEGEEIGRRLKKTGQFDGLPKQQQDVLKQDTRIFRLYASPNFSVSERQLITRDTYYEPWAGALRDLDSDGAKYRDLFSFDSRTLRFGLTEEIIYPAPPPASCQVSPCVTQLRPADEAVFLFGGRCEKIPTRIQQHGPEH